MTRTLEEKKQLVLDFYQKSYDYDLALKTYEVTDEERDLLEEDSLYCYKMQLIDSTMKAELVQGLVHLSSASNKRENVRLEAIKQLGRMLYPEVFKKSDSNDDNEPKVFAYIPTNGREKDSVFEQDKSFKKKNEER